MVALTRLSLAPIIATHCRLERAERLARIAIVSPNQHSVILSTTLFLLSIISQLSTSTQKRDQSTVADCNVFLRGFRSENEK
jgi:hypothetical protein